jgi:hypothetical protein
MKINPRDREVWTLDPDPIVKRSGNDLHRKFHGPRANTPRVVVSEKSGLKHSYMYDFRRQRGPIPRMHGQIGL